MPKPNGSTVPVDLSRSAIARNVLYDSATSLSVTVPVALGAVAAVAAAVALAPWSLTLVGLVGAGVFAKKYYLDNDKLTSRYLQMRLEQMRRNSEADAERIRGELQELRCEEGVRQFDALPEHVESVTTVLTAKFGGPPDLTFMHYSAVVEQARSTVLTQLRNIAIRLKSVAHLASPTTTRRGQKPGSGNHSQQGLRESQEQAVKTLLVQNEEVLTSLSQLGVKIADIEEGSRDTMPTDELIAQLSQLAKQASLYSKRKAERL